MCNVMTVMDLVTVCRHGADVPQQTWHVSCAQNTARNTRYAWDFAMSYYYEGSLSLEELLINNFIFSGLHVGARRIKIYSITMIKTRLTQWLSLLSKALLVASCLNTALPALLPPRTSETISLSRGRTFHCSCQQTAAADLIVT